MFRLKNTSVIQCVHLYFCVNVSKFLFLSKFVSGSLPGLAMTTTVGNAIKNRASNEEILIVLKDVPNPNQDDDDGESAFWFHMTYASHLPIIVQHL